MIKITLQTRVTRVTFPVPMLLIFIAVCDTCCSTYSKPGLGFNYTPRRLFRILLSVL